MQTSEVHTYLSLLQDLSQTLSKLTEIEQKKINAVRQDDLDILNQCMKQEQALTLTLRGFEQRRQTLLSSWNLSNLPLSGLSSQVPTECREETKRVAENLLREYELFRGSFEVAQNTLECNLHQIEKHLSSLGASPTPIPGYEETGPKLPSSFRTDFRA